MKRMLIALAVGGFCVVPAFAQDAMMADTTSCADYTAMDSAGQMTATEGMMAEMEPMEGETAAEAMTPEASMMAMAEACAAHPDMMVGEAMEAMGG